jgi:hypothetical protein
MSVLSVPGHLQLKNQILRFMLYTLFALIVADGLLTQFLVTGGFGSETNPFLRAWIGQDMFLAFKVSGAFLVVVYLWFKHSQRPKLVFTVTLLSLVFYTAVIFWNLFVFLTV